MELENRERLGTTGPAPLPHPDHIHIDMRTGDVVFTGPLTREEARSDEKFRQRIADGEDEIEWLASEIVSSDDANSNAKLEQYIEGERSRLQRLKHAQSKIYPKVSW